MLGVCCPVFDRDFVLFLRFAKFVVGVYKNSQHRFQRFLTPEKTSALLCVSLLFSEFCLCFPPNITSRYTAHPSVQYSLAYPTLSAISCIRSAFTPLSTANATICLGVRLIIVMIYVFARVSCPVFLFIYQYTSSNSNTLKSVP